MDPTTTTTTTTTTVDETRGKRNSAYIPVHRRRGNSISDNRVQDDKWIEEDEQAPKRQSMYSRASSSDIDSRRSSRQFAWSRQQQRFSLAAAAARYGDDTEDSDNDPLTPHQRFSRPDSRRNSTADKLHMALEGLSVHDEPDWEELLRQYDRYDDGPIGGVDSRRSSKRQSRIMDPFNEPAPEIPVVDEPTVVLDCYDFPSAFKTHHLHDIFREYENMRGGYRIKWKDDTRALIIFEHPTTAKKAYIDNVSNPLAKIRPYNGPTDFLKSPNMNQRRPASMDLKRASYNGGYGMKSPLRPERQSIRG
ncbi:hypothetical protein RO3G_09832 [Lichtheimia corymbifera JMRC:FSU:9682]|uniref:Thc1 RRM domain-containing protein n=1 Tax=Lichtheimia corymbifera JMRC:FSU:9682 TaxID=1263082 RepID=A0A068RRI7_9FUNG|nr:hypothetical protein RO3G_09832 [Lichtheimia corymbifera JMRC:FSU:9682]